MERIINEKFGCQIIERDNKLFIRFDQGELVVEMKEFEISEEEANFAMKSEDNAYQLILKLQNKNK